MYSESLKNLHFIQDNTLETPKGRTAVAVARHLYNEKIISTLGKGSQGEAYQMGNGQVIKVTGDITEYNSSREIAGIEIPHVNIIYRCVKVEHSGVVRHCIIQKYAEQIYRDDVHTFEAYTYFNEHVKDLIGGVISRAEFDKIYQRKLVECDGEYDWYFKQYKGIAEGLLKAGYAGRDLFYKNTGWDKDRQQLVMIDLGYSGNNTPVEDEIIVIK